MLLNIEVKNEIGSGGGAPHVQNAAYAAAYTFQLTCTGFQFAQPCF